MAKLQGVSVPDPSWTPAEIWAWQEISGGRVADFNTRFGALDPATGEGWGPERALSAAFLRSILSNKPWTDRLPIEGVRIKGARWSDRVVLPHARLNWSLSLEGCRFERPVDLGSVKLDGVLSLRDSVFDGADGEPSLILDETSAWRIDLAGGRFRKDVSAVGAACAGVMNLSGATLEGKLDLERARIGCLFLRNIAAKRIVMTHCEVEQDVDLSGAETESLKMSDLRVGRDLLLCGSETRPALFAGDLNLVGAIVGGGVTFAGATVTGEVNMNALEVKEHLFMRTPDEVEQKERKGATVFRAGVDASFAEIGGYLELPGAEFAGPVVMEGIRVGKNLSGWGLDTRQTVFRDQLSLINARIKGSVDLNGARFEGEVELLYLQVEGHLNLNGRTLFEKDLTLAGAHIGGNLFMGDVAGASPEIKGKLTLDNAGVDGQLELTALCHGSLACSGLRVGTNVFMQGTAAPGEPGIAAIFKDHVQFGYAKIGGLAVLNEAAFEAGLSLNNIQVGQDLRLTVSLGGELDISNGNIGGDLTIDTKSESKLDLRSLRVGQDLNVTARPMRAEIDMRDMQIARDLRLFGAFGGPVLISQTRVGRALDTSIAYFLGKLDLSASSVAGQLCLHVPSDWPSLSGPEQRPEVWLDLRDAKAGSLRLIDQEHWPLEGSVQLDGFTYDRLGGSGADHAQEMMERSTLWYEQWLALDRPYSPQPYEHLAAILRQAGQSEKADRILYAGRERARAAVWDRPLEWRRPTPVQDASETTPPAVPLREKLGWGFMATLRWLGLTMLNVMTGYGIGHRYFRALGWAVFFTIIGGAVLSIGTLDAEAASILNSESRKFAYSFDQLLPFVDLNAAFGDVKLTGWVESYFYLHKLFGFLLGTFIAAGVAGLTQRSRS